MRAVWLVLTSGAALRRERPLRHWQPFSGPGATRRVVFLPRLIRRHWSQTNALHRCRRRAARPGLAPQFPVGQPSCVRALRAISLRISTDASSSQPARSRVHLLVCSMADAPSRFA